MSVDALLQNLKNLGHEIGTQRGMSPEGQILWSVDGRMLTLAQMHELADKELNKQDIE
jgi:hypothetical protein